MTFTEPVEKVGPDAPAGRILRQYWQPVAVSKDLSEGMAQPLRILGEELTLYRGESGKAYVIGARCAHRYTWLHTGRVEEDCLRCFYHGWKYDGSGQCVEQPAEKNERFAEKVRIPGYPVEEYAGLIFVFMGEGNPPPLPRYPLLDDPGFEPMGAIRPPGIWPINYFQMLENSVDPVHTAFVHGESEPLWNEVPEDITIEETGFGLELRYMRSDGPRITHLHFPNMLNNTVFLDPGDKDTEHNIFLWHVPIDDENSFYIRSVAMPKELIGKVPNSSSEKTKELRNEARVMTEAIGVELMEGTLSPQGLTEEDYVAVVGQGRYADRSNERLGASDVGVIAFRKLWRRAIEELEIRPAGTLRSDRREDRPQISSQEE